MQHEVSGRGCQKTVGLCECDEGNVVVFGQHESFIENTNTGQRIPMSRRSGVFVIRLDAQPCWKAAGYVGFGEGNTNEWMPFFRRPA